MSSMYGPAFALSSAAIASTAWNSIVLQVVREPYLDEVFHVRQAQVYCAGDFQTWDPKITTPPGLYLISYLIFLLTGKCDIGTLRISNVATLSLIALECFYLLKTFSHNYEDEQPKSWKLAHTALNISLFPPIFFFSALYYTDLQSLLLVLLTIHLSIVRLDIDSWVLIPLQVLLGDASLAFRQTNVFWVAIFPMGLTALDLSKKSKMRVAKGSGCVLVVGWLEEYIEVIIDLVITSVENLASLVVSCLPYVSVLGLFAAFVVSNGGVVLGDKSNHVATIHIPQMLYIWPFITFFSFPVILQTLLYTMPTLMDPVQLLKQLPRIWILLVAIISALVVVHYNTIVHPFTLADNRHYVFYVFRILRRHWLLKYAATPLYGLLAWISIQAVVTTKSDHKAAPSNDASSFTSTHSLYKMGFLVVWLVTSAISLITAPLVEPRYYIIPWALWRISLSLNVQSRYSLWLETVWYALINILTGYVFLYGSFEWKQEPGKAQRFMW